MLLIYFLFFFPLAVFYYLNQKVFDKSPKWRKAFGYSLHWDSHGVVHTMKTQKDFS